MFLRSPTKRVPVVYSSKTAQRSALLTVGALVTSRIFHTKVEVRVMVMDTTAMSITHLRSVRTTTR
jgi:uncharacterized protein (UPF0218 family)